MNAPASVLIYKWLWAVRIYKTRSQATEACRGGHVRINGHPVKASHDVKLNEILAARTGHLTKTVKVLGRVEQRVSAAAAKAFAEDLTPAAEYQKAQEPNYQPRFFRPKGLGRPTKKERRKLDLFGE